MKDKVFSRRSLGNNQGNTVGANVGYQANNTHMSNLPLCWLLGLYEVPQQKTNKQWNYSKAAQQKTIYLKTTSMNSMLKAAVSPSNCQEKPSLSVDTQCFVLLSMVQASIIEKYVMKTFIFFLTGSQ